MKKFVIFFLILLFNKTNVQSQIGIRFGLNSSSFKIKALGLNVETDNRLGFHFGVIQDIPIENKLYLRPGILFSIKGAKSSDASSNDVNKIAANYVEAPLSVIYYFMEDQKGFFGEFGPYIGALISASADGNSIKDEFNTLDYGINIGAGYDFNNFIIGANYSIGLNNIAKTSDDDIDASAKNLNLNIFGIYQF